MSLAAESILLGASAGTYWAGFSFLARAPIDAIIAESFLVAVVAGVAFALGAMIG